MASPRIIRHRLTRIATRDVAAAKVALATEAALKKPSRWSMIYPAIVATISAMFAVISVVVQNYITSAQLTASFDALRIAEENRVFSEYMDEAQKLCASYTPKVFNDNYEPAFANAEGIVNDEATADGTKVPVARRKKSYKEITDLRPEGWSVVNTATFIKMTHLHFMLMRQTEGIKNEITFDFLNDYSATKKKIDDAYEHNASADELATLYLKGESSCYAKLVLATNAFVFRQFFNGTRVELKLLPKEGEPF